MIYQTLMLAHGERTQETSDLEACMTRYYDAVDSKIRHVVTRQQVDDLKKISEREQEAYDKVCKRRDEINHASLVVEAKLDEHLKSLIDLDIKKAAAWASVRSQMVSEIDAYHLMMSVIAGMLSRSEDARMQSINTYHQAQAALEAQDGSG